ncbi:MAG TPA: tetratricopeptide repeat protein [Terriglobales bacterium]|nr:tetratricopeptide repeat protein [Terriglobales bacterium]
MHSGELRKNGARIRLQQQPLQVLALLLERPGEVVTREELRERLWPGDVYVDFDRGLNKAIGKLRDALGDLADSPQFIETLPKIGYRFLAPVGTAISADSLGDTGASLASESPAGKVESRRKWLVATVLAGLLGSAVLVVLLLGFSPSRVRNRMRGAGNRPVHAIAVLPLVNLSSDPAQEYFADGMTDALIAGLSQIKAVRVISRTSIMHYKGTSETSPQIAQELGVDKIVEASVMRSGNRVRITVQLIEAREDRHLWARIYERDITDVLALQSELVQAISSEIKVQLTPQENERLKATRRVNPEAYEAYLKARFYWNKRTGQDITKGIEYFQHAIEIDPDYAHAYVGLADSYVLLAEIGDARPREAIAKARAAAAKAIEIDTLLAEAHAPLAFISAFYDYDWAGAEREFKRAVELNPGDATAHQWYAHCLSFLGRHDEATAEIERARSLDPLSLPINTSVGTMLLYSRHYDSAIEQYRKALEMDPNFIQARDYLGNAYLQKGMYEQAIAEFQKAVDLSGGQVRCMAGLGRAYAAAGRRDQARNVIEQLKKRSQRSYVSRYELALIHTGLGEKEQAFALLEQAYEEHDRRLVELGVGPQVDPLRSDPRFQDLLRRIHLSQ